MTCQSLLIRNGRVIDPARSFDQIADVRIENGKIAAVMPASDSASGIPHSAFTIDATGKIVCPGLIDMHVHLREPGGEDEETIASGAAAAVAGGFTSIACMPNTDPPRDNEAAVEFVYRQAARAGLCNVFPIGAITKKREGKELAEMGQMVRAGAVAFSDDGRGVASPTVMLRALQYAKMVNRVLIQHCEDPDLAEGGAMNAGLTATRLGLPGIPAIAEEIMLQRDLLIAQNTEARYHAAHLSTAGSIELVRRAKQAGVAVTAEVCPHHLLLTDDLIEGYDTNYKMNPPLRGPADVEACIEGVIDGTIDCLVTDHAPHSQEEKELDFQGAPFGIIGLEAALGLYARALIQSGRIDWPTLIARMTIGPARVLGLDRGTLTIGADADVTIIDPNLEWVVEPSTWKSRSRNCPYAGWRLTGRTTHTLVGGRVCFELSPAEAAAAGA